MSIEARSGFRGPFAGSLFVDCIIPISIIPPPAKCQLFSPPFKNFLTFCILFFIRMADCQGNSYKNVVLRL